MFAGLMVISDCEPQFKAKMKIRKIQKAGGHPRLIECPPALV
jgi:hypothetical protein